MCILYVCVCVCVFVHMCMCMCDIHMLVFLPVSGLPGEPCGGGEASA